MNGYPDIRIQDAVDLSGTRADGYVPTWSAAAGGLVWSAGTPGPTGPTGVTGVGSRRDVMLSSWGILDETYDFGASGTSNLSPVSGRIYSGLVGLNVGDVVGNILAHLPTAGVGTPPSIMKFGLATAAGTVVKLTANVAADSQWTDTGQKVLVFPLTSAYTVAAGAAFRVCFIQVGTWGTSAAFLAARSWGGSVSTAVGAGIQRFGHTNAQSDLPAVGQPMPAMVVTGSSNPPWMAVAA